VRDGYVFIAIIEDVCAALFVIVGAYGHPKQLGGAFVIFF